MGGQAKGFCHCLDEEDIPLDWSGEVAVEVVRNVWIWGIWSLSQQELLLGWAW